MHSMNQLLLYQIEIWENVHCLANEFRFHRTRVTDLTGRSVGQSVSLSATRSFSLCVFKSEMHELMSNKCLNE